MQTAIRVLTTAAALAALAVASGCGDTGGTTTGSSASASAGGSGGGGSVQTAHSATLWVGLMDCSESFRRHAEEFIPDLTALARQADGKRVVLNYGCFAGRALNDKALQTLDYSPGGQVDQQAGKDEDARADLGRAHAIGAGANMQRLIDGSHYGGSDPLAALERASGDRRLARVAMWSDFLVHDDSFRLVTASPAEIRATAKRWIPRMQDGLRGVTVLAIGAGRGARGNDLARRAELLMGLVVHGAGGRFGAGDSVAAASANVS